MDGLCSNRYIKKIHLTICFSFLKYTYFSFHIFNDQKSRVSANHRIPSHQAFSLHRDGCFPSYRVFPLHRDGCFPRYWVFPLHRFLHLDCCYPNYPSLRYYHLNKLEWHEKKKDLIVDTTASRPKRQSNKFALGQFGGIRIQHFRLLIN